ncbi:LPXTG cell wall anchor domain-containing protein [Streptomyces sp. NPDC057555]|uniref:LPXTG cell wall anchor domain-containing protein n=1 Tax=Streptomyces sp. NPDC057555 TaxID=3346166 RepID=UPI00368D8885
MTVPTVLLTTGSAFADSDLPAQTQHKPTYAELQKAAEDAKKAYDAAVDAKKAGLEKLKATMAALDEDTHPLKAAWLAAEKVAKAAGADKAAADRAVVEAQAKLAEATDEAGKTEARKALAAAEARAEKATADKADADTKRKDTRDAWDDARVAASREYNTFHVALDKAAEAQESADQALAAAKKCVRAPDLTVLANGLPSKVVAGTTVDFSFTVANGTDRTLDVDPLVFFNLQATDEYQHFMKVQWSNGSDWQELDSRNGSSHIASVKTMKPGARSDVKMRMTLEAKAPANKALALLAGDASDPYNPCVLGPMKRYDFEVLPAGSKPGTVDEAKPGTVEDKDRAKPTPTAKSTPNPSAQGGASAEPAPTSDAAEGNLATTGSSSAMPQLALAGGAAVLLGTGAVLAVRRNRAAKGSN